MNFDRPAFARLITAVKQRMVRAILVKDFSRFGRDYIEVGDYLERFFPFMGVRFLSASDSYDSGNAEVSDDRALEIAMQNIVNTYYSRDISQKVTSSVRSRREKGEYVYAARAFGYVEDPADHRRIVIDPEAAGIVRRIFDLALEGLGTARIARRLNEEGAPTPALYAERNHVKAKYNGAICRTVFWDTQKVRSILHNEVYTGTFIGQRTRRVIPGQKKLERLDGREQAYIRDHHEAIVTHEEWEKAQGVIKAIQPNYHAPYRRHAPKGKVACGNCGHTMTYVENKLWPSRYQCEYQRAAGRDIGCVPDSFEEGLLDGLVFNSLKIWFGVVKGAQAGLKESEQRKWDRLRDLARQCGEAQNGLHGLQERKVRLYEDYTDGRIGRGDFAERKEGISARIDTLRDTLDGLHRQEADLKKGGGQGRAEFRQLAEQVDIFKDEPILTKTMADVFLEKVVVNGKFDIKIVWKWSDVVEGILAGLMEEGISVDGMDEPDED